VRMVSCTLGGAKCSSLLSGREPPTSFTGQRRSDIIQFGMQHAKAGKLTFMKQKGRPRLYMSKGLRFSRDADIDACDPSDNSGLYAVSAELHEFRPIRVLGFL
jgi:hypothetical protein